ncbi:hypothetical protein G5I_02763 [Acromyrmex echinatior]|uniref:Uncharacterized protein n=1 Tax=Acromyrmex echinatior TaxID=103372 RepID=F4WB62_ACREC|nr:hypothetical protein G5I_02763 [Acromyrmex echinatior]
MSRRGPVLETRREDFANDKGSSDKEASWSRTRKAFLVRVVRKSTSRVGREITELANEWTGDSTANTWTDRESFLRATTTSEVLTSTKFSLCDEVESLLSESTSTKTKLVDNDREMSALTRVIQLLFGRPTRAKFYNSLCNRYVDNDCITRVIEYRPREESESIDCFLSLRAELLADRQSASSISRQQHVVAKPREHAPRTGFMEDGMLLLAVYLRLTWLIQPSRNVIPAYIRNTHNSPPIYYYGLMVHFCSLTQEGEYSKWLLDP